MVSEQKDDHTTQGEELQSEELRSVITALERITFHLKMWGAYCVAFSVIGIVCPILIGTGIGVGFAFFRWIFWIGLVSNFCAVLALVSFDLSASKGGVFFKEASDELQWFVRFGDPSEAGATATRVPLARPQIRTRIVLREYASSTRLPFLNSASNGSAIYAALNLVMAFLDIFMYRLMHSLH